MLLILAKEFLLRTNTRCRRGAGQEPTRRLNTPTGLRYIEFET